MKKESIIFLGDSIMEWTTFEIEQPFVNLGVSGETTETLLNRIELVKHLNPRKVFLMIGLNDLAFNLKPDYILENYEKILNKLVKLIPNINVFCISLLPTDDKIVENEKICGINKKIKKICKEFEVNYMDIYGEFLDDDNCVDDSYRLDFFTLNEKGYDVLNKNIRKNL